MISIVVLLSLAGFLLASFVWIASLEQVGERTEDAVGALSASGLQDVLVRPEFVARIFSSKDTEFIQHLGSPRLKRLYLVERRKVALHWVEQTSCDVRRIMRAHRLQSRQSQNLEVATEAKLFLQYLKLRLICGVLAVLIRTFSPHTVGDLAIYASLLYDGMGRALSDNAMVGRVTPTQPTAAH